MSVIYDFLKKSKWAKDIPVAIFFRAVENSICFGIYYKDEQIGFARVVTDQATFAYLVDVFILEGFRGKGLATWMMDCVKKHPNLQNLRKWLLATDNLHHFYSKFGFQKLREPDRLMEIYNPNIFICKKN